MPWHARWSRAIAPSFLTLTLDGSEWSALNPSKWMSPQYPPDSRLGGSKSLFSCCGVQKNLFPLPRLIQAIQSTAYCLLHILSYYGPKIMHYHHKSEQITESYSKLNESSSHWPHWVSWHHNMGHPQIENKSDSLQMSTAAENILNA
jgi:hypothetical protein